MRDGVTVLENEDFIPALASSAACIAEPSTASLIPCLLGLPVFLVRAGQLKTMLYGEIFDQYPRALYLERWEDIPANLSHSCELEIMQASDRWISDNSCSMPTSEMPMCVASVVFDLVKQHSAGKALAT